ncbi:hypothetical protein ANAPC5_01413 [Anaplasma phagocytophilum]|nr:hypothetical protein ANAPC2_01373 [Anaplasma phagocytophilum]SCV66458.1 hypothetical protein ANAPC5_01413 [Anaplasma phagocytophilum]
MANIKEVLNNRRGHVAIFVKPSHKFKRFCGRRDRRSLWQLLRGRCHVRDGWLIVQEFLAGLRALSPVGFIRSKAILRFTLSASEAEARSPRPALFAFLPSSRARAKPESTELSCSRFQLCLRSHIR